MSSAKKVFRWKRTKRDYEIRDRKLLWDLTIHRVGYEVRSCVTNLNRLWANVKCCFFYLANSFTHGYTHVHITLNCPADIFIILLFVFGYCFVSSHLFCFLFDGCLFRAGHDAPVIIPRNPVTLSLVRKSPGMKDLFYSQTATTENSKSKKTKK